MKGTAHLTLGGRGAAVAGAMLGSLLLLSLGARARPPGPPGNVPSSKYFKNIQVLKSLPANKMIPTMEEFSRSLGVRCAFCHVAGPDGEPRDFQLDTKPQKRIARAMIRMTLKLNAHERILNKMATCYMCHRGHEVPETKLPAQG